MMVISRSPIAERLEVKLSRTTGFYDLGLSQLERIFWKKNFQNEVQKKAFHFVPEWPL